MKKVIWIEGIPQTIPSLKISPMEDQDYLIHFI